MSDEMDDICHGSSQMNKNESMDPEGTSSDDKSVDSNHEGSDNDVEGIEDIPVEEGMEDIIQEVSDFDDYEDGSDSDAEEIKDISVEEGMEDITHEGSDFDDYKDGSDSDAEGIEDISVEEGVEDITREGSDFGDAEIVTINNMEDFIEWDLKSLSPHEMEKVYFVSLEMAFLFYKQFARVNGFSARKGKVLRNSKGIKLQQTFVCYRQGFRQDRSLMAEKRKREPRPETRCGCQAKFRVHINIISRRWYVTQFTNGHNHELLEDKYSQMLPSHRRMSDATIMQMNSIRKVGISIPHIYGSFASLLGRYERIGFQKKDIYNQIGKQRKLQRSDATSAIEYLSGLGENDPLMFTRYVTDEEGRLQQLFWCDGIMRKDYEVFGDVLAFDVTYGLNKYQYPFVIFSGVNHHNQTTVFGSAVIGNETEATYVWILEQFLEAMKGKSPASVITDGDLAMKNAIQRVFPKAHHRLCAWHLIRNATGNVKIPTFTSQFRKCMLGDYEIGEFRRKWNEMVSKFGVQDHRWVKEMYEKRKMWATAHIRGNFFAVLLHDVRD